jgi:hypothetical protein
MAQRYGRNQKRKHREKIATLEELYRQASRSAISHMTRADRAQQELRNIDDTLARIAAPVLKAAIESCARQAAGEIVQHGLKALAPLASRYVMASVTRGPDVRDRSSVVRVEVPRVEWNVLVDDRASFDTPRR